MGANREYKDSVFSWLFSEPDTLRLLLYIAKIYEKITGEKDIYREKRIPLPRPYGWRSKSA